MWGISSEYRMKFRLGFEAYVSIREIKHMRRIYVHQKV